MFLPGGLRDVADVHSDRKLLDIHAFRGCVTQPDADTTLVYLGQTGPTTFVPSKKNMSRQF